MYRFKKILVGLGKSEHDAVILRYAGWLSRMAKSQKMILFHAVERPDSFSCLPSEYAECFEPPEPLSREKMEELARKSLDGYPEMVKECQVIEGDPFGGIIQKVREEDIDLVILGRKTGRESNRNLPLKLARKAPCSVWVIPEGAGRPDPERPGPHRLFRKFQGRPGNRSLHRVDGESRRAFRPARFQGSHRISQKRKNL